MMTTRLRTLAAALGIGLIGLQGAVSAQTRAARMGTPIAVYKTPTCGCCGKWIEHLRANGFVPTVTDMPDVTAVRTKNGVPAQLASCHTAIVRGYVIEGHVPAADIKRLLREKPTIAGLSAPGMPAGSPGMDVPNSPGFDVIAFDKSGHTKVFASHPAR